MLVKSIICIFIHIVIYMYVCICIRTKICSYIYIYVYIHRNCHPNVILEQLGNKHSNIFNLIHGKKVSLYYFRYHFSPTNMCIFMSKYICMKYLHIFNGRDISSFESLCKFVPTCCVFVCILFALYVNMYVHISRHHFSWNLQTYVHIYYIIARCQIFN